MKSVEDLGVSSGKWYVGGEEYDGGCIVYSGFGGRIIARANHYIGEAKANARLIGCAKEMYEALAAFVSALDGDAVLTRGDYATDMILYYAKKVIAKAAGEEVK